MKKIHNIKTGHKPSTTIKYWISICVLLTCCFGSCKKYLDLKPDQKEAVPSTLADCQALLDNLIDMNFGFCTTDASADDHYLTYADWQTLGSQPMDGYIWKANADVSASTWGTTYQTVLYANQALQTLGTIPVNAGNQGTWNDIKGEALFFRAFSFYFVAQVWAQPYHAATAGTDLGIPLRLTPDISVKTVRSTVQQTYNQIIQDLNTAVTLLPDTLPNSIINKSRPCKTAAYAALARVYLTMGDYANAAINANACLQRYGTLIDFNTLKPTASHPLARFNAETIFFGSSSELGLAYNIAKVDSNLHASYASNDLRLTCFFGKNTGANAGTFVFKGGYTGSVSNSPFCGLATDEQYLIRAECYARAGDASNAMADLNTLLSNRWVSGTYTNMTATDASDALAKILVERRKELLFRGLRWTDLRRLNTDARFAITLTRVLNGTTYTLPPNDLRYTLLIPQDVILREPMPQNPR